MNNLLNISDIDLEKNDNKIISKITINDCYLLGESINCVLLSNKFENIRKPLTWLCKCGNKFNESYINIKSNNRSCLKCSYKKFNSKNKK